MMVRFDKKSTFDAMAQYTIYSFVNPATGTDCDIDSEVKIR